jgi:uncharacterized membrane protein
MKPMKLHVWMAVGLLLISASIGLRAIGPASLHSDMGDLFLGLLAGLGLGIEIMALIKLRRAG